jgi:hypothetical protein
MVLFLSQRMSPRPPISAMSSLSRLRTALPGLCLLIVSLLALPTSAAAQVTPRYPNLTDDLVSRIESGEVVVSVSSEGNAVSGQITALVDAPVADVWSVLTDWPGQEQWVPDMYDARIVSGSGERLVAAAATSLPWPISDRTWQVNLHNRQMTLEGYDCWVSSWTYIEGSGNMVDQDGFWMVTRWNDDPNRTLVYYRFRADAGIPAPSFMTRNATRTLLPQIMAGLRGSAT